MILRTSPTVKKQRYTKRDCQAFLYLLPWLILPRETEWNGWSRQRIFTASLMAGYGVSAVRPFPAVIKFIPR